MNNRNLYRMALTSVSCTAIISTVGVLVLSYQGKPVSGTLELALAAYATLSSLLVVPPEK